MRKQHHIRLVVTALAALALALPAGQAAGAPDDRPLYRGTTLAQPSISPDDRSSYRGTSSALAPRSLGPDDRAFVRSAIDLEPRTIPVVASVPSGFDWGDAAIGGSLGAGLVVLAAGAALFGLRHRRGVLTPT